jgi:hypothetical protein
MTDLLTQIEADVRTLKWLAGINLGLSVAVLCRLTGTIARLTP